jgi:dihydrofolate synthase/folylpolyglutamate synthase
MTFDEALSYLLSLGHETLAMKLGLEHIERLLKALRNPHKSFLSVQIAGTNGKGSTAVMLESILCQAGIRAGLFTSPHLVSITERIRIDGQNISESSFARLTSRVRQTAEELVKRGELPALPTFFEHVTAVALLAFRDAKLEVAILETGLGGRLDATTAAGAEIAGITSIGRDHEQYLGHTISEIAAEKAAIIQPGITAIIAPQRYKSALSEIRKRCQEVGVTPVIIEPNDAVITRFDNETKFDLRSRQRDYKSRPTFYQSLRLGLKGAHQIDNASLAIALSEAIEDRGFSFSSHAVGVPQRPRLYVDPRHAGLEYVTHPGRLEWWEKHGGLHNFPNGYGSRPNEKCSILFDGAHNPAAAAALSRYLRQYRKWDITMIFGVMADKDFARMAELLFPRVRHLILTEIDDPRSANANALKKFWRPSAKRTLHEADSVAEAWRIADELTTLHRWHRPRYHDRERFICVTGSLHLVGEVQKYLQELGVADDYSRPKDSLTLCRNRQNSSNQKQSSKAASLA